jgi:hypothetical protein
LLFVLAGLVVLNKATLFPGWGALLPTVGALLLISAGPQAWINRRILANRFLVLIGLISYPLYLWHWPLLSYAQIMSSGHSTGSVRLAAVVAAFLLAWLTYRWIEMPARSKPHRSALLLVTTLIVVAAVSGAVFTRLLPARSEHYGIESIVEAAVANWDFPGTKLKSIQTPLGYHWERGTGTPRVLFFGDSHIEQYYSRIDRLLSEHPGATKGILFVTQRSCPPIDDVPGILSKCSGLVKNALYTAQLPGVDTVVIGAAWNRYDVFRSDSDQSEAAFRKLADTVKEFRKIGRQVYLILPTPRGELFDPATLVKRSLLDFGFVIRQEVKREDADATVRTFVLRLKEIARSTGATVLDPMDYICQTARCQTLATDGLPIYTDDSHLRPSYVREHVTFLDAIVLLDSMA